jgi:putative membrane protein
VTEFRAPAPPSTEWRRLHPLTLLLEFLDLAKSWSWLLLLYAFGITDRWLLAGVVAAGVSLLVRVALFLSRRFRIHGDQLLVRSGVLTRQNRVIPRDRIQNVKLESGPLQRLLGVTKVTIETAGSQAAELELKVVGQSHAEHLRAELLGSAPTGAAEPPPPATLVRSVSNYELFLAGATETRVGFVLVALFGVFELLDDFGPDFMQPLLRVVEFAGQRGVATVSFVLGLFAILFVGWVGSILFKQLTFHGFTLLRTADGFRKRHGLLTRFETFIPQRRLQAVRLEANPLHRWLQITAAHATTAGSAKDKAAGGATTLCPFLHHGETPRLLWLAFPGLRLDWVAVLPVHHLAKRRGFVRFGFLGTLGILLLPDMTLAARVAWWLLVMGLAYWLAVLR